MKYIIFLFLAIPIGFLAVELSNKSENNIKKQGVQGVLTDKAEAGIKATREKIAEGVNSLKKKDNCSRPTNETGFVPAIIEPSIDKDIDRQTDYLSELIGSSDPKESSLVEEARGTKITELIYDDSPKPSETIDLERISQIRELYLKANTILEKN